MASMIESLEGRLFLSASADTVKTDVADLKAAGKALTMSYRTNLTTPLNADVKKLKADLKHAGNAADKTPGLSLLAGLKSGSKAFSTNTKGLLAAANKSAGAIAKAVAKLEKTPGDTKSQAALTAAISALQTAVAPAAQKITDGQTTLQTSATADLNTLAANHAGDATIQADIQKFLADLNTGITAVQTAVTDAQTHVTTLIADAGQ